MNKILLPRDRAANASWYRIQTLALLFPFPLWRSLQLLNMPWETHQLCTAVQRFLRGALSHIREACLFPSPPFPFRVPDRPKADPFLFPWNRPCSARPCLRLGIGFRHSFPPPPPSFDCRFFGARKFSFWSYYKRLFGDVHGMRLFLYLPFLVSTRILFLLSRTISLRLYGGFPSKPDAERFPSSTHQLSLSNRRLLGKISAKDFFPFSRSKQVPYSPFPFSRCALIDAEGEDCRSFFSLGGSKVFSLGVVGFPPPPPHPFPR